MTASANVPAGTLTGDLWADVALMMATPQSERGRHYVRLQQFDPDYRLALFALWDDLNPVGPTRPKIP